MCTKKLLAIFFAVFAFKAHAVTTVILEDGTVIETEDKVYISAEQLYTLQEADAVSSDASTDEPEDKGSPEWCAWYLAANNGTVVPSFDEGYSIYVQNCRGD